MHKEVYRRRIRGWLGVEGYMRGKIVCHSGGYIVIGGS